MVSYISNKLALHCLILSSCISASSCQERENTPYSFDFPSGVSAPTIPSENLTTSQGVELGRYLFYEKLLSKDNSMACSSCHIQKFGFSEPKKVAVGVSGNKLLFNTIPLANVAFSNKLFWDGRGKSLEKQALAPVVNHLEMDQRLSTTVKKLEETDLYPKLFKKAFGEEEIIPKKIAFALSQFERTLISFNSKYDKYLKKEVELSQSEKLGMELFFTTPDPKIGQRGGGCVNCHLPNTFAGSTSHYDGFKNNGLNIVHYQQHRQGRQRLSHKNEDYGKFKVPSLRNIEVTHPYMHDGRFGTLEDVLDHYSENIKTSKTLDSLLQKMTNDTKSKTLGLHLTSQEKESIITFLYTLTDRDFLNDPNFSSPFLEPSSKNH